MAGHSKWHNIKHKKAKEDAKKGKAFTKLSKEISVVVKNKGADIESNPRLRLLLDKARDLNMPKDNVERAIKKGLGPSDNSNYEEIMYECYGPDGIAVLVDGLTDNKNRTASDLRHFLGRNGGRLSESGSVAWMFDHKGDVQFKAQAMSEDQLLEKFLDANIDELNISDGIAYVSCNLSELDNVRHFVLENGFELIEAKPTWVPQNPMSLLPEQEEKVLAFLEGLSDLDDVQDVYANIA